MAVTIITPSVDPEDTLISLDYDATWLEKASIYENTIFAWGHDVDDLEHPTPIILGSLASPPAGDPGEVISPQWLWRRAKSDIVILPDLWRGNAHEFFIFLSTNNGARRVLWNYTKSMVREFDQFRSQYPELAGN